jgi:methyl-accepting chemotaxis protein
MKSLRTMSATLTIAFASVSLVPLVIAAVVGYWSFNSTMDTEASTTIREHGRMALDVVGDRGLQREAALRTLAADRALTAALGSGGLSDRMVASDRLKQSAYDLKVSYILLLDPHGVVVSGADSTKGVGYDRSTDPLTRQAAYGTAQTAFEIVPTAELETLGLTGDAAVKVTPVAGLTTKTATTGALALTSVMPIKSGSGETLGTLAAVEVVNNRTDFVDRLVSRLGGTATLFQDEVRVTTTVLAVNGKRAIGTVASQPVQTAVLKGRKPFVGPADVVGNRFETMYQPLNDVSGHTVGMLYVGIPLAPYEAATNVFMLRILLALLGGLAVAWIAGRMVARTVARPVEAVSEAAGRVSAGDLKVQVPVTGASEIARLGDAFNSMTSGLSTTIRSVREIVAQLGTVSTQLVAASDRQSQVVTRQVAAAHETTATLEEMAASYRAVAAGAQEVMRLADEALSTAESGHATAEESMGSLERLQAAADGTAGSARDLSDTTIEIGEVLTLIDNIAEQTKILALNAAIEAARAGEAGKGFGVVATEIRSLADSVSKSTARIDELVRGIQTSSGSLSRLATDQASLATTGVEMGRRSADAFSDILDRMAHTASAAREIATAAAQQGAASGQVLDAMQQVTAAASESSAAAGQVAQAARAIDDKGRQLQGGVDGFRI